MSEIVDIPFYMGEDESEIAKMEEGANIVFLTSKQDVTFCIMFDEGSEHGFNELLLHVKKIKKCKASDFQACVQLSGIYDIDGGVNALPLVKQKNFFFIKNPDAIRVPISLYFDGRGNHPDDLMIKKWMTDPF